MTAMLASKKPKTARFDVVVPIHNSYQVVRLCLSSLARTSTPQQVRIICVLDACDDHTIEAVQRWAQERPNSDFIILEHNVGFVGACNAGIAASEAEFVVLVNSDTCATPRWTELFSTCFDQNPTIGIASPLSNFCPHNTVPVPPGLTYTEMAELVAKQKPTYPDITTCEGFFYAIRRRVLDDIGWIDGIFGHGYCEESDFSMRANYYGWRTVLLDNCFIFHFGRESFGSATRQAQYDKNKQVFFDRWRSRYTTDFEAMRGANVIETIRSSLVIKPGFPAVKWV